MKKYLIPNEGNFYKANMHAHTTVSDGKVTPEEVKEAYKANGYSIVAYTDHEIVLPHKELADEEFLPITAYEVAVNKPNPAGFPYEKTYHLNLYSPLADKYVTKTFCEKTIWLQNVRERITDEMRAVAVEKRSYTKEHIQWIIDTAKEEGFLVSLNHPVWSLQNYEDYTGLRGLWGVEWHNTACVNMGYVDTLQPITDLLSEGERMVYPIASDDCHRPKDFFGGWLWVKAEALEYVTVFEALRRGDFYSSTGPQINELYIEDGVLHVKTSAADTILLTTDRRVTMKVKASEDAGGVTEALFDLNGFIEDSKKAPEGHNCYIRISVKDSHGNAAHTRAYFVDEF